MKNWNEHVDELGRMLQELQCSAENGALAADDAFGKWADWTLALRQAGGTIYLVGNGASASMASHMAADLAKNAQLHTQVFSDLSLITAISNDMGYEKVFSEPLRRRARAGDMLVAISSSGQSPNVLAAVEVAKEKRMTIVTLSGMDAGNDLRAMGSLNFHVAAQPYGYIESAHAAVLHYWMDRVEAASDL